ncbi:hypothetical protein [Pseudoxanthomonas jiangsuensis]|uniref:hypothetical protein n=1 Tax=Pseudoxanthomonas jiangsuensis TaxID=619688 RepID=UPI001FE7D6A9|nr:hypothetical protein [Pseudoxanthomonas jiangsuensis]
MKLLNNPALAGKPAIASQFAAVAASAAVPIPKSVDVLSSTKKDALLKEVFARHAGGQDGAGQLTWDTLLRTIFLLGHQAQSDYRLAGLLLMWAEDQGIDVDDQFPISTIHRFLNKKRLERLGFKDLGKSIELAIPEDAAVRVVERIVHDFAPGGSRDVNDVFEEDAQNRYIDEVLRDAGLLAPEPTSTGGAGKGAGGDGGRQQKPDERPGDTARGGESDDGGSEEDEGESKPPKRGRATVKADYDRKSVVRPRFKPDFPENYWKAREVLRELRQIETGKSPIAAASLFRVFFELSTRAYTKRHQLPEVRETHKNALTCLRHMRAHGRLSAGEHDAALRRFREKSQADMLLQYATLNDYMHSFQHMPDRQSLHVLWTEIEPYLEACWDDARRPR